MKFNKTMTERIVKEKLEKRGDTFIRINWKHATVHYLDSHGNKGTQGMGFSLAQRLTQKGQIIEGQAV